MRTEINSLKSELAKLQPLLRRYKEAYELVSGLKLYAKTGRAIDEKIPFILAHPEDEFDLIKITSINTRRKAKAMLFAQRWLVRDKYNRIAQRLANLRNERREAEQLIKTKTKELRDATT